MFEVSVTGRFVGRHQLRRPDGSHEPLHEHEWSVKVTYAGEALDEMDVLLDFGALRSRLTELLATLDQQNLNHLPPFAARNPSAENVALHLAGQMADGMPAAARLVCVEVEEQPGCVARYYPSQNTPPRR